MKFSRILLFAFGLLTFGLVALASPAPLAEAEKRQLSSITDILDGLTSELGPILSSISESFVIYDNKE